MKHKSTFKFYIFIVVFAFASLASAPRVFADILSQNNVSADYMSSTSTGVAQTLGTGLSGTSSYVQLYIGNAVRVFGGSATPSYVTPYFLECTSSAYTTCTNVATASTVQAPNPAALVNFPLVYTFDSSKYYVLGVQSSSGVNPHQYDMKGSTSSTFSAGQCYGESTIGGSTTFCRGLADIYFVISDTAGAYGVANNIRSSVPASGATNVDANINFNGTYSNDGTYNTISISLRNLTTSASVVFPCTTASVGTSLSYTCNYTGAISTSYSYNPYLWNSSTAFPGSAQVDFSKSFSTGTTLTSSGAVTGQTCQTFDFGCYLQNAFNWLFSVSPSTLNQFSNLTLSNSLPFSYVYDVGTIFNELFANGGSMSYAVSASTPIGTINFISASAISAVPYTSTIKTILGYLIYFMTAMTIYRIILKVHNHA